jgi:glutathione S-transferase
MLSFGTSSMDMMLWQIRIHEHILPTYQRDARTVRRYRNKFALEVEPQLKSRLSQTAFVCGEKFTAADCVIGHNVLWAQAYALCSDAVFTQYIARLSQRPAFARAFADLNQFVLALPEENTVSELFTG